MNPGITLMLGMGLEMSEVGFVGTGGEVKKSSFPILLVGWLYRGISPVSSSSY